MLGIIRYILAMMVACSHLWWGLLWWQGTYAVFCFYVISGYLMTLVLNETYLGPDGAVRYLVNRALRIYPVYLAIFALSVTWLLINPGLSRTPLDYGLRLDQVFGLPGTVEDWFANITLLPPWKSDNLTVSQAWSLRVELFFYVLMLFLVRSRTRVVIWCAFSAVLVMWQELTEVRYVARYTGILGASIAFSLGSLIYHFGGQLRFAAWHLPLSLALYVLHLLFAAEIWSFTRDPSFALMFATSSYGIYCNTLLGAYVLTALVVRHRETASSRLDKWLGDLAYPVFLVHWLVGALLIGMGVSFAEKSVLFPLAFLLINGLALALHLLVELPVNRHLRAVIRRGWRVRPAGDAGTLV